MNFHIFHIVTSELTNKHQSMINYMVQSEIKYREIMDKGEKCSRHRLP